MSAQAAAPPPRPLPPLSFLDGHGLLIRDADSLNARILQHLPMPASVTPAPARGFFHRSVIVGLGDVTLSDSLHGPLTFTAGGATTSRWARVMAGPRASGWTAGS